MDIASAVKSVGQAISTVQGELEIITLDAKPINHISMNSSTSTITQLYSDLYNAVRVYEQELMTVKEKTAYLENVEGLKMMVRMAYEPGKIRDERLAKTEYYQKKFSDELKADHKSLEQRKRRILKKFEIIELQAGYNFLARNNEQEKLKKLSPTEIRTRYREEIDHDTSVLYHNIRTNTHNYMVRLGLISEKKD